MMWTTHTLLTQQQTEMSHIHQVLITHFWLKVKWTAHCFVIDFKKVIEVLKETNKRGSVLKTRHSASSNAFSPTVTLIKINAENVDESTSVAKMPWGPRKETLCTFWISSGESVEMLRICCASCRLIPVMLEAAADCWGDWLLACAAAWLAARKKNPQKKQHNMQTSVWCGQNLYRKLLIIY